jgi:hypothetical protein
MDGLEDCTSHSAITFFLSCIFGETALLLPSPIQYFTRLHRLLSALKEK